MDTDPDTGSQNLADPTDPDPKHWVLTKRCTIIKLLGCLKNPNTAILRSPALKQRKMRILPITSKTKANKC